MKTSVIKIKKLTTLFLACSLALLVTACGKDGADNPGSGFDAPENALALLNTVWASYGDEEKFPAAGGDFSEENSNMEGPGRYSVTDPEAIDASLGFPAASIDQIDDAASLMHMMNANTFTCGVYHIKEPDSAPDVASALEDNIKSRQWMCGFPEKLLITSLDSYVIAAYGNGELMDTFQAKLDAAYPSAKTLCFDPIE